MVRLVSVYQLIQVITDLAIGYSLFNSNTISLLEIVGLLTRVPEQLVYCELLVGVDAEVLRVRRPVVHHQLPVSRHRLRRAVEHLQIRYNNRCGPSTEP